MIVLSSKPTQQQIERERKYETADKNRNNDNIIRYIKN